MCELLCAVLWCVLSVAFVRVLCVCVLRVVCCDVLWDMCFFVFVCVGDVLTSLCGVVMAYCVLSHGLCLCWCACVRVGLKMFVRFVRDLLCDVA